MRDCKYYIACLFALYFANPLLAAGDPGIARISLLSANSYLVYICLAAVSLYLYLRYKTRQTRLEYQLQILRLNEENEKAEKQRREAELARANAEKAKKEAELEAQRVIFTTISHEFRTPLTLILNPLKDLLKNRQNAGNDDNDLQLIYHNARRMLGLVDQLLLFQKADSGLDNLKLVQLDLGKLVKEVYSSFEQLAVAKSIDYQMYATAGSAYIQADRQKLEIILYNLLSNAFKYTPDHGKIHFYVELEEDHFVLEIQDSGPGIPESAKDKLFEKFYQANTAKAGFGIGLYLVKRFVEAHNGNLSYTSETGKGTSFVVCLPAVHASAGSELYIDEAAEPGLWKEMLPEAPAKEQERKSGQTVFTDLATETKRILVVDDNTEIRRYVAGLFNEQFTVFEGRTGEEGLTLAHQYQPDIIISDVVMQGMSGIELCKAIKEDSALCHIPVILLTSNSSNDARLQGVEVGADDYITKPFDKDLLAARVTALIKSKNNLQKYFYNEITLQQNTLKVSGEYKTFLDNCIAIVEAHLDDDQFTIQTLAQELGMSYSKMNKKIKAVSGQPANAFVRFIRLRKAAELFINSNYNVNETAFHVGIADIKHFREHFTRLFGMRPSEYIERYRKNLGKQYHINEKIIRRSGT
ncbi:hybrid sensor histidine kinase/response regulator transcription factor [Longitalea luteola]|uniref:hybrid sensor histidine kinase/response regulator transcription factor n=1 Tax=Longitalea luteola TaxID=2812563 RepID=UPI001A9658EE|nr:ATP-binding protein [Longitalea luteola]